MKLTVLCDNFTYIDRYYLGEPAFSCLIEDGERVILFDAGYSDVFIENARRMGIDLARVTDIVLSHGHNDHTGGLPAFFSRFSQPVRLYAHPDVFRPRRAEGLDVGTPVAEAALPGWVDLRLSRLPQQVSAQVHFLAEIPRRYAFEQDRSVGEVVHCGVSVPDPLSDDSSLALTTDAGLFLVTGCAHSGICNTAAQAIDVCGEPRIAGILGGMHLFETDADFAATADELARLGVGTLYPCHCTSLAVKAALIARFDVRETGVSLTLEL